MCELSMKTQGTIAQPADRREGVETSRVAGHLLGSAVAAGREEGVDASWARRLEMENSTPPQWHAALSLSAPCVLSPASTGFALAFASVQSPVSPNSASRRGYLSHNPTLFPPIRFSQTASPPSRTPSKNRCELKLQTDSSASTRLVAMNHHCDCECSSGFVTQSSMCEPHIVQKYLTAVSDQT
ncbi:hypothetical protein BDV95DRAFT_575177 [Massariosphaeria phaeospora]|uniref:Uncharacterized protein n=1 Tax=Massariosphaeria phaeospora TaxID=100035 RepID=A0A7C8M8A9_9PLEO|nr:hypothetical protein BDV95DRAFT_575177 [Massariosphaeria phaeospora]